MGIEKLVGEKLAKIEGMEKGSREVTFTCESGKIVKMAHDQDCREVVSIEDVDCEASALIGATVLQAYESQNEKEPEACPDHCDIEYKWTFYRILTDKGGVCLRWFGTSNGFYSVDVHIKNYTIEALRVFNHTAHKQLWQWLSEDCNRYVGEWPGWLHKGGTHDAEKTKNWEFTCASVSISMEDSPLCDICPLVWPGSQGCNVGYDGLYGKWTTACRKSKHPEYAEEAERLAKQIRDLPIRHDWKGTVL